MCPLWGPRGPVNNRGNQGHARGGIHPPRVAEAANVDDPLRSMIPDCLPASRPHMGHMRRWAPRLHGGVDGREGSFASGGQRRSTGIRITGGGAA